MNNIIKRVWNQNRMVNIEDLSGAAFQAEDGGHTFQISGIDDTGATVALSGTVAGVFRRPDNADIALTGSASGGVASVTLTDDCYAVPGRFGLTIFVTAGGQKTAVYAAIGTVSSTSGGAVAGETPQDVVDLINAIEAAVATIPADYTDLMAAIAPTYSNAALYAVGAYAWQDGKLYRSIIPITTAETWTAAHWTQVALGNDVTDLKSALEDVYFTGADTVDFPSTASSVAYALKARHTYLIRKPSGTPRNFAIFTRVTAQGENIEKISGQNFPVNATDVVFTPAYDTDYLRSIFYDTAGSFSITIRCLDDFADVHEENKTNPSNNPILNDYISELYVSGLDVASIDSVDIWNAAKSGSKYYNGLMIHTSDGDVDCRTNYSTEAAAISAQTHIYTSNTYKYYVNKWDGTTGMKRYFGVFNPNIAIVGNTPKCDTIFILDRLNYQDENIINLQKRNAIYTNNEDINNALAEFFVPESVFSYDKINRFRIYKAQKTSQDKYVTGVNIGNHSSGTSVNAYHTFDTEAEALLYCTNVFEYMNVHAVINWDNIPTGETVGGDGVTTYKTVHDKRLSPSIFALSIEDEAESYNKANPILQSYMYDSSNVEQYQLFTHGMLHGVQWRTPSCLVTKDGSYICGATDREGYSDDDEAAIYLIRVDSSGNVGEKALLFGTTDRVYGNLSFVQTLDGTIYAFAGSYATGTPASQQTDSTVDLEYKTSSDDGVTWSSAVSIKAGWDTTKYHFMINSPTNGFVMDNGTIIIPAMVGTLNSVWRAGIIYNTGNGFAFSSPTLYDNDSESVAYMLNGNIALNCRTSDSHSRNVYYYDIENDTFTLLYDEFFDPQVVCEMSVIKTSVNDLTMYLMSFPDSSNNNPSLSQRQRDRITLWGSLDGKKWIRIYMARSQSQGYSCVSVYGEKIIMIFEAATGNGVYMQDISGLKTLIYATMITQYNRSIEYRLQEVIDRLNALENS